jgi:hypothetical protein
MIITLIFTYLNPFILYAKIPDTQNWSHYVRIAGHGLNLEYVDNIIKSATETYVFGIETDNSLTGIYESFLDPHQKLKAIKTVAEKAHKADNYAFIYTEGLEIITHNADEKEHTFFKDHPDWAQRKITGEAAIFGGKDAFWISEGDEDVWISPYAKEWRKIYMERIRQIAKTGIDGVYIDIPYWMTHFNGWEDSWASFDDYTVTAFKEKTKLDAKTDIKLGDYSDPNFIKWIDFRIETITDFMKEVDSNVKSVNPECITIAEIYPGIGEEVVRVGSDVYELYEVVDVIAHEFSAGGYTAAARDPIDWFSYIIGMYTFRAFAGNKASWMLSYSWDGEDAIEPCEAMKNLFMTQLAAGTNVWDARGHVMSGSNDMKTRKEIFKWIKKHESRLYLPRKPIHPVGIYFSPKTRNYFPKEFINSYTGIMNILLQSHLEFQIITPRNLEYFNGEILILPDVKCVYNKEIEFLNLFISSGGSLIITGETGRYNEKREIYYENPIHALLGIKDKNKKIISSNKLKYIYYPYCPGKVYLNEVKKNFDFYAINGTYENTQFNKIKDDFYNDLIKILKFKPIFEIVASPFISTQIVEINGKTHIFFANFRGLVGNKNAVQNPEKNVKIIFPTIQNKKMYILPFLDKVEEVEGTIENGKFSFIIPEIKKGMVVWWE